jgi:hypothetical protein
MQPDDFASAFVHRAQRQFRQSGSGLAGGRSGDAAAEADGRCQHEAFGMNTRLIGSGRYVSFGWSEVAHQFDDILGKLVSVTAQVSADGAGGSDMESSISGNRHIAKGDASQVGSSQERTRLDLSSTRPL